jgi:uncharacterized membrane protein SpoIIM required for sporulation
MRHILYHGVIELSNAIVYSFLSVNACINLFKKKKFGIKSYIKYVHDRKHIYIGCLVLVFISGIIEGLLS